MAINESAYKSISIELKNKNVELVAVSKIKPVEDIIELYQLGQKDFGENYVQELAEKHEALQQYNIHWHFIGHLQSNKVKYIVPFVYLIHSVDSLKLLKEIDKQAAKNKRIINCLLQVYIAKEETKFGLDAKELEVIMTEADKGIYPNVNIKGLMGMASFTEDIRQIQSEFAALKQLTSQYPQLQIISMGMSQDYELAIAAGSNMVRIGSLLFGARK